ncbi:MAG: SDR family oxidoreductase [Rhodospirillaceae bacterium]|nr:SDR family oxidoreductase [Rhodospirillaceae bacterium]
MAGQRVLVLGAGGFIGRHIFAALADAGHVPIAGLRDGTGTAAFAGWEIMPVDFRRDHDVAVWGKRLQGIDAVVNCIGVLTGPDSRAVHVTGPQVLRRACEQFGVRRLIHVSAISASDAAGTAYAADKRSAEDDLRASDLDWIILRPSLVYADGSHGGTSVLRGLSGFPGIVPLPGDGCQIFSPIHAEDLARAILRLLAPDALCRVVLEPCGPETLTLREIVLAWRKWLGLAAAPVIHVPMPIVRGLGRVMERLGGGPLSATAVRQLEVGNAGDGRQFAETMGFTPDNLATWLRRRPSSVQDKWHARLYFLRPLARIVLAVTWLLSGLIGLFAPDAFVTAALAPLGLDAISGIMKFLFCGLDIAIGLALLARWRPWTLFLIQMAVVLAYTLALSLGASHLWIDPFGPLVKNGVFLVLAAFVAALEDDR